MAQPGLMGMGGGMRATTQGGPQQVQGSMGLGPQQVAGNVPTPWLPQGGGSPINFQMPQMPQAGGGGQSDVLAQQQALAQQLRAQGTAEVQSRAAAKAEQERLANDAAEQARLAEVKRQEAISMRQRGMEWDHGQQDYVINADWDHAHGRQRSSHADE
jgi:hypothetical protein